MAGFSLPFPAAYLFSLDLQNNLHLLSFMPPPKQNGLEGHHVKGLQKFQNHKPERGSFTYALI